MKTKRLKKYSLINLICGYLCAIFFIFLIIFNRPTEESIEVVDITNNELFDGVSPEKAERAYLPTPIDQPAIIDRGVGIDYGRRVIVDSDPDIVVRDRDDVAIVDRSSRVVLEGELDSHIYEDKLVGGNLYNEKIITGDYHSTDILPRDDRRVHSFDARVHDGGKITDGDVDYGILDRRLAEREEDIGHVDSGKTKKKTGLGSIKKMTLTWLGLLWPEKPTMLSWGILIWILKRIKTAIAKGTALEKVENFMHIISPVVGLGQE